MQTPYPLSTDYELLYQLAKAGFEIPCWVDNCYDYGNVRVYRDIAHVKSNLCITARGISYGHDFYKVESEKKDFIECCISLNLQYIKPTLHVGEWIIANIIGEGIYEIVSFDDYHVRIKLKKMFLKGWADAGHITCCHNRPEKINLAKWLGYKRVKRP